MIVGIHQPEFLPWMGFFDKMDQSDVFVLLDNVQYEKNYFQNRNKIRTSTGWKWLTVPVFSSGHFGQKINEVKIMNSSNWTTKHWLAIKSSYSKSPFWSQHSEFFESLYASNWDYLAKLNEEIIMYLAEQLFIKTKIVKASELGVTGKSTSLLLSIVKKLGGDVYLSGVSGRQYLEVKQFEEANIQVRFQDFKHPNYTQMHEGFIPQMSIIDLIFNYGASSIDILRRARS